MIFEHICYLIASRIPPGLGHCWGGVGRVGVSRRVDWSLNRSLNRSLAWKATHRPIDRATERATEQKTHPESRDRPNRKTSKNRAVQGSCAHKFVQKSGSIIGRLEPKFSLSPPLLRCFGGASLNPLLNDLGIFRNWFLSLSPPSLRCLGGAFLCLFFASVFLKSPSQNRTVAGGFA